MNCKMGCCLFTPKGATNSPFFHRSSNTRSFYDQYCNNNISEKWKAIYPLCNAITESRKVERECLSLSRDEWGIILKLRIGYFSMICSPIGQIRNLNHLFNEVELVWSILRLYQSGEWSQSRAATKIFEGFGETLFQEFIMVREL